MKKKKIKKMVFVIIILGLLAFFLLVKNNLPKQEQDQEINEKEAEPITDGGYPQHPVMEDCEKLTNRINRSFCIGDVAEIERDSSICMKIENWEIGTFCLARTTTNKTLCKELIDEELKKECLRYITEFLGLP